MRIVVVVTALLLAGAGLYYAGWKRGLAAARSREAAPVRPEQNAAASDASFSPSPGDEEALLRRDVQTLPISNLQPAQIQDTFNDTRGDGGRRHEATDILAPRGTPVLAVSDGTIAKLFLSVPGGNTIYEFDPGGVWCFYYAHLDGYAPGLAAGTRVKRGEVIGFVGTTGNARNTPHLHIAFSRLGPERHWWQSTPVNPYPVLIALARQHGSAGGR